MWPATVATIIKVLSPVQIEYAARRRRLMMPKDQAQDHHLAMILINREPVHAVRPGKGTPGGYVEQLLGSVCGLTPRRGGHQQQSQAVEDQELSIGAAVGVVMLPPLSRVAWGRRPGLSSARAAVARYCVGLDGHHRARNASLPRRDEILGRPREIAWPRAVGDSRCWS